MLNRPATGVPMTDADAALAKLYDAHYVGLVRLAVLLLRDPWVAEEVVQDSFVAMHRGWDTLDDPDRAIGYLRTTVINRSRSVLRHRAVVARHFLQPQPDVPGADAASLDQDRRRAVLDAMRELPRRQREVLALRYYLDYSEREIAEALGISQGAVKSHASRGAASLRRLLRELEEHR
ncbi:MAG: SigE family RNA polymerase sigma factor [Actinomycetota bacterium]|nr:SigE family RNA polymerase sigma factor [Actinomycetota bacterium]